MATANPLVNSATPAPLANSNNSSFSQAESPLMNGNHVHTQDHRPAPVPTAAAKKGKQKKALDSTEASKLVAARISQLEVDNAAEKEESIEIDRETKKDKRELQQKIHKMPDTEKVDYLLKRCSELFTSMKRLDRENQKNKKRADQLQKEKDSSRSDLSKQIGLKEKLEKLCRELQKENNKLKNEHRTITDAHERLKTSSDERFKMLLETMEGYQEEKDNPRKQVVYMKIEDLFKARFKSLIDQYDLRDLHFHSLMRTKEIEVQWNMARYEQQKKAAEAEASRCRQLNQQVMTFSKTETELRNQLNVYVEKFKQVEDTLNNSNDLFLTFRKEMEDMSKKTKKLEKENEMLKRKQDALNQNIFKMAEERTKNLKDIDDVKKKNEKLTSIINQMQQQGRGIPQGMQGTVESCYAEGAEEGELEDEDGESEYDYEEEEEEEGSEEGGFDDETEDELQHEPKPTPYGPERPPPVMANGHA